MPLLAEAERENSIIYRDRSAWARVTTGKNVHFLFEIMQELRFTGTADSKNEFSFFSVLFFAIENE